MGGREAGLDALAGHDVAQTMRDQRRAGFVDETKGARQPFAGLERLKDSLMVVQAGVTTPGHADEPRIAPEGPEALERLGMPPAGGLRRDIVAVEHHDPARARLRVRQTGWFGDELTPWAGLWREGGPGIGPRQSRQVDMPIHLLDGNDRERQLEPGDDLVVLADLETQWT